MTSPPDPRALTVVMYTPSPRGGHAAYTRELLNGLAELGGCTVELVTCVDAWTNEQPYPVRAILPQQRDSAEFRNRVHWALSRIFYYSRRERVFIRWLRERSVDIVHLQEFAPWLGIRHLPRMRRFGARVVITVHNVRPHGSRWKGLLGRVHDEMYRVFWRKSDCLLVHSDVLAQELSQFLGKRHPAIVVTAHGAWPKVAAKRGSLPLGTKTANGRLLFFGVLRPNKGLETLISALEKLPHLDLVVAGAPSDERYHRVVRRLVAGRNDRRVVLIDHFLPDEEVAYLFQQCDLLVLPYTRFSSQSGVLHLAITYGLPVVVTDVGGLGETVRHFDVGEVVPPGDPSQMATAINKMLQPSSLSRARQNLAVARQTLSWSAQAAATLAAYNRTLRLDRGSA